MKREDYLKLDDHEKRIVQLEQSLWHDFKISDILTHHGVQLVRSSGANILGYCPFHPDSRPGSFVVNDNKGSCFCYSCGKGGNAVKYIEITEGLNHAQAVLQLACDEDLISETEYAILSNKSYSDMFVDKDAKKTYQKKKKKKPSNYLKMANDVYSLFPMAFGLSDEDYFYLKNERHLYDERIQNYFTIDNYDSNKFIKDVLRIYPEYTDSLKDLAGFFEMDGKIQLTMPKGIGILIRNAEGLVVGIQVRKRHIKEGEQRYTWVTSNFATYSKMCSGGSSPGAPIDVLSSVSANSEKLAIVEGRFKSEILAQMNFTSLSVQGVGNYVGIEDEINAFPQTKIVFVFYDADMLHNTAVLNQAIKLGEYINEKRPDLIVKYCVWHEELGKGIDDLVLAGNKKDVKCISQERLTSVFEETLNPLMEKFGFTSTNCKLTKEQRDAFNDELKTILVEKLL